MASLKAPAPAMIVAAAALLLIALLASAPRAKGGGVDCSRIPLYNECLNKGVTLPTDPNSLTFLSGKCCNGFADGERECLCRLRNKLRDSVFDPKKILCPASTGCPDT